MDFNNQYPNKNRGGIALVCVILTMLIIVGLSTGAFVIYKDANVDYQKQLNDIQNELDSKYSSQILELQATIDDLENTIKTQSVPSVSSSVLAGVLEKESVVIQDIAASVKPSIVAILVTVPSTRYQNGFFSYSVGGISTSGTGIILNNEGYVVTNYHVVSYFDEYENVTIDVILSEK